VEALDQAIGGGEESSIPEAVEEGGEEKPEAAGEKPEAAEEE